MPASRLHGAQDAPRRPHWHKRERLRGFFFAAKSPSGVFGPIPGKLEPEGNGYLIKVSSMDDLLSIIEAMGEWTHCAISRLEHSGGPWQICAYEGFLEQAA